MYLREFHFSCRRRIVRWDSLGKKKVLSEEEIKDMVLPVANDVLGVVLKLLGFDRVLVKCQDGYLII